MSDVIINTHDADLVVKRNSAFATILTLIRADLLLQLRERGTLWLAIAVFGLIIAGTWQGGRHVRDTQASITEVAAFESSHLAKVAAHATQFFANPTAPENAALKSWRNPADVRGYAFREHVGYAVKPLMPGAGLAIAQGDVLPHIVRVKAESMDSANTAQEIEHPARLAAGRFDLLFVVLLLWPLVLIAFCATVVTADREAGRLRLLQLHGASRNAVLLAGISGRVGIATLLFIIVGALLSWAYGALSRDTAGVFALLQWSGLVLLYSAFWALVIALICWASATPAAASFSAFASWVAIAVLLPGLIVVAVNNVVPLPSRESHILAVRNVNDQIAADRVPMLERFYDQHPHLRPPGVAIAKISMSATRLVRAEEMERLMAPVEARVADARAAQQQLFSRLKWISPVSLAYEQFARLSGNDSERHAAFLAEVRAHQLKLRSFFNERLLAAGAKPDNETCGTCMGGYGFNEVGQMPRFKASTRL